MDYKVVWSPEAIEDIESIAEYISRDSEFYAKAVVTAIINLSGLMNFLLWPEQFQKLVMKTSENFSFTAIE